VQTKGRVSKSFFDSLGVEETAPMENVRGYEIKTTRGIAEKIKNARFVKSIQLKPTEHVKFSFFNSSIEKSIIPKRGANVLIKPQNIDFYFRIIQKFEENETVERKGSVLFIQGKHATHYRFKKNYYFMVGDHSEKSFDSRYWGVVPEDLIIGKATLVLLNNEIAHERQNSLRTNRIWTLIR
jgi:signal peptidase I